MGLRFLPALYALISLWSMWDPASHERALPAGLVNLDAGVRYRDRDLNLGADVPAAIEAPGLFACQRFDDPAEARRRVRQGDPAFILEVPADFSQRAVPGEAPGAAKLTVYTSEGNNCSSAGFARRFAPEVAQRVNTMLGEARWELVLNTAAGSQRNLDTLRQVGPALRGLDARRPSDADLSALRLGTGQLTEGQRDFGRGLDTLAGGGSKKRSAA